MEPIVVFEDELCSVVFGHKPAALGHLKVYPKPKVKALEELPAKQISHLFSIATRCASLLFDGLQAGGTNLILNDGKNANQADDNLCIDVISRSDGDGLKFNWDFKQGDYPQVKQVATEIASKVIVYEKPLEVKPAKETEKQTPAVVEHKKEVVSVAAIKIPPTDSGKDNKHRGIPAHDDEGKPDIVYDPEMDPTDDQYAKKEEVKAPKKSEDDEMPDPKKNFLFYELMRMP